MYVIMRIYIYIYTHIYQNISEPVVTFYVEQYFRNYENQVLPKNSCMAACNEI